jgi:hypothetical protein
MLHLFDHTTMRAALTDKLDPQLHRLLTDRLAALGADLMDYIEYLIIEPGDTEADIIRHIGFSPLVEAIDGVRFGGPGFQPPSDWIGDHTGWFELIITFGSTFAYVLFVQDAEGTIPDLVSMCRAYSA